MGSGQPTYVLSCPPDTMGIWIQRDGNDLITKHEVRWVVKGFKQCYGVDYSETYASVVMSTTYSVAFKQVDVETAFLNGVLEKKAFVIQPMKVCCLKKALYGLKQSP